MLLVCGPGVSMKILKEKKVDTKKTHMKNEKQKEKQLWTLRQQRSSLRAAAHRLPGAFRTPTAVAASKLAHTHQLHCVSTTMTATLGPVPLRRLRSTSGAHTALAPGAVRPASSSQTCPGRQRANCLVTSRPTSTHRAHAMLTFMARTSV